MITNYLKTALRNIKRNATYSAINVAGLAIGLASCLLILTYVQHELSYDSFHPDADRIYRVGYEVSLGTGSKVIASSPYRLAEALKNDFPRLRHVTHFSRLYTDQVTVGEQVYRESRIAFADTNFFDVFQFSFVTGDPATALDAPYQVVITDAIAEKYFGGENPLGRTIGIGSPYSDEQMELTVAGVIEEMPSNTHFHMNFLVSMPTGNTVFSDNLRYSWGWDSHYTYVTLAEGYRIDEFQAALPAFGEKYIEGDWFLEFFAQKASDIHLYSNRNSEIEANGSITYIYIFSAVALIILLIACINYVNLATAQVSGRAREVGVRKAIGAQRGQLVGQFLGESVLTVTLSMMLALGLAELSLPLFNELAGKSIDIRLLSVSDPVIPVALAGLTLLIGLFAGLYPALFLSSLKPVKVLKEATARTGRWALILRKGLVTVQLTVSVILIAGTLVVFNQLDFLRSKNLGAETENVVLVPVQTASVAENYETIRQELLRSPDILEVTSSNRRIGVNIDSGSMYSTQGDAGQTVTSRLSNVWVGWEFFDLYGVDFISGRGFSRTLPSDTLNNAVVINREAARTLVIDPEGAVGKQVRAGDHFTGTITGVVDDFHFESLYNQIKPMVFFLGPEQVGYVSIKVSGHVSSETMDYIEGIWKEFEPDRFFLSDILDEDLQQIYVAEERFMKVFSGFTLLALFTACLGIFGLARYSASQRTREIGIRKVLGAKATDIVKLLSSEVVRLTGIAVLVAVPVAYLVMSNWLQQFAYKTSLDPWIFLGAGLAALVIAWMTVSWQAFKAALRNPVDSLRSE